MEQERSVCSQAGGRDGEQLPWEIQMLLFLTLADAARTPAQEEITSEMAVDTSSSSRTRSADDRWLPLNLQGATLAEQTAVDRINDSPSNIFKSPVTIEGAFAFLAWQHISQSRPCGSFHSRSKTPVSRA